jgi:signal transduction histidine kinase
MFLLAFWGVMQAVPGKIEAHIHLIFTFIILIVVNALVISFVIRKLLRPLSQLSQSVQEIGKGNLDLNIPVSGNDELGKLAQAFNKMTVELKDMLRAREQLLLDVSHELRTPITRAKLALEMMPESTQKYSLEGDLRDMEIMITEILESERLRNGIIQLKIESVAIGELLYNIINSHQGESGRFNLFPVDPEIIIHVDKVQILTVLRNILSNALKYSPPTANPIEISVIQRENHVIIQIEDFGQGIPEESLPYVFNPFYRADQSRSRKTGGYGLGLHICKRIMDMHNAEIKLENKKDGRGVVALLIF